MSSLYGPGDSKNDVFRVALEFLPKTTENKKNRRRYAMNLHISAYTQGSDGAQLALTRAVKISVTKDYKVGLSAPKKNVEPLDVDKAAKDLGQISSTLSKKLKFTVDHKSHEILVKVIDPETNKVVNVLPPEELRRVHSKIKETLGGLFDELM
jgi:flagellar protein FlaG